MSTWKITTFLFHALLAVLLLASGIGLVVLAIYAAIWIVGFSLWIMTAPIRVGTATVKLVQKRKAPAKPIPPTPAIFTPKARPDSWAEQQFKSRLAARYRP